MLEKLAEEGFAHINPPIPVWVPAVGDSVRGYILARQMDRNGDAFYVLQLTEDWNAAEGEEGGMLPAGIPIVIFETRELRACEKLVAHYQTVKQPMGETRVALYAYEVVLIAATNPLIDSDELVFQVHGRRVAGQNAKPPIAPQPPPFVEPSIPMRTVAEHQAQAQAARVSEETTVVELRPDERPSDDAPPNGA